MIHPKSDWTEAESKVLEPLTPEATYFFVLGYNPNQARENCAMGRSWLQVTAACPDLETARVARREAGPRGQVRVGSVVPYAWGKETAVVLL